MSTTTNDLPDRVGELLGVKSKIALQRLHGDASNRIYYRATAGKTSYILMQRPQAALESPSEEITKGPKLAEYAFLNIQRYLEKNGIRVPKVVAVSQKQDLLLLEDLGEVTVEKFLQTHPKEWRACYEKAVGALSRWQQLKPTDDCIAWQRRFDGDLLDWEFEHFIEWGLERSLKIKLPEHELKQLRSVFRDMVAEIVELPTLLVHRDFQSRNLMVIDAGLAVLDFQDALVGPYVYDLVALLRDSYIDLPEADLVHLQRRFAFERGITDETKFLRDFDLQTAQRKLKDGGRFFYIDLFKGNPNFLPHAPASFCFATRALKRLPEGTHVLAILKKYRPEFAA